MNIVAQKLEDKIVSFRFEAPERLAKLNIGQLQKLYRRSKKYGLHETVKAEVNRRINNKKPNGSFI